MSSCKWGFVRYADDFVVMTKTQEELPAALNYVKEIIFAKMGLLSFEKQYRNAYTKA